MIFFRMFITGFNTGLWVERVLYLLILSCIYKKVDEENLFRVWKIIGIIVMAGIFYQSFQVYILGQSVSTINIFPFLQSNSENYLLGYDRPHSFFFRTGSILYMDITAFMYVYEKKKAYLDGIYFDKHFIIDIFNGNINDRSNMAVLCVCKCQKRREIF